MTLSRRHALALPIAMTLAAPALAQDMRARTLRFVPSTDLVSLDPVISTALVAVQHGFHVFDTLYGVDGQMRAQPQMAEGHQVSADGLAWTIRLREGLRFHDGEPVRASDCAASLARWSRRDSFGRVYATAVEAYETPDDRTLVIRLKRPFPRLPDALAKPHSQPAFIMPERIIRAAGDAPITEVVGSGPYRFLRDEWSSGHLIAYARFDGYRPRGEAPEWTSGGKVAHFERVEWRVIADKSTAVSALIQGEVDWMETVPADLQPLAARNRRIRMQNADPLGSVVVMRFNHLAAPFNNPALRRFVLEVARQADYLATVAAGDAEAMRPCAAMFPCTIPGVEEIGRNQFGRLAAGGPAMAEALRATGYAGEKVVILNPADNATLAPLGPITAELLRRAGLNVELLDMDFGTLLQRRNNRGPVERGGWSLFVTTWPSIAIANPVLNTTIRGEGATGWPGWFESAQMEQLTQDWLAATDAAEQARLMGAIHALALREVPTVPLGIYFPKTGYRAELTGVLGGSVRYPWNVRRG